MKCPVWGIQSVIMGTSPAVQWLRPCASNAGDTGSIPGPGTKSPHAAQQGQNKFFNKMNNYVMSLTGTDCNQTR